jgi:hypothetical protein
MIYNTMGPVGIGYYDVSDQEWYFPDQPYDPDVTHWMPLPNPPT